VRSIQNLDPKLNISNKCHEVLHSEVICSYSPEMDSSANNDNKSWKTSHASRPGMHAI